ncbi:MAG TPA: hypothetical protein VND64_25775 [Pirellulales bacterium]|nr:hypothetical protein [Pirellulales bacterium]
MTGSDFIAVAIQLLTTDNEARLRSAVSRAYYGAFHDVREFVESLGVAVPRYDVHDKLWWCLRQAGERDAVLAGNALNVLRSDRNAADYNLKARLFTRDVVRVKVELAVKVVDLVDLCRGEPLRSRLHASIRPYAANVLKWPIA